MMALFQELRRRNVFRVAAVYAVTAWLIAQAAVVLEGALRLPDWFDTIIVVTLLLGFPVALILAWAFELTPDGFKPTDKADTPRGAQTSKKRGLNIALGAALAAALGFIAFDSFILDQRVPDTVETDEAREASIAVLPFEDFSPDKDQDYFANGISEELLNVLAKIDGLRVSSRTSSFAFKGQETPISEIGTALDVAHVLEGSIRSAGATVRITAQLIDTDTDVHLWSETYDRPLTVENVFEIQDEIAAAIVSELRGQLDLAVPERVASEVPTNLEAYQLSLRGRDLMRDRTPDALREAIGLFEASIALDADYAPAHAGIADAYLLLQSYGGMGTGEALDRAQPYIDTALRLDPNSSEALNSASLAASVADDIEKSLRFARLAVAANPSNSDAYIRLGNALGAAGDPEGSLSTYERGLVSDPLNQVLLVNVTSWLIGLGRIEEAAAAAEKLIKLDPRSATAHVALARTKWAHGNYVEAHASLKTAQSLNPDGSSMQDALAYLYVELGMPEAALSVSDNPRLKSQILAALGRGDDALALLPEDAPILDRIYALYFAEDYEAAYSLIETIMPYYGWPDTDFAKEPVPGAFASTAYMAQRLGKPETDAFLKSLSDYYGDRDPKTIEAIASIVPGAIYFALIEDWPRAYAWFDHAADLGKIYNLNLDPAFDGQRETAEYRRVDGRLKALQATYRDAVRAQLADPPDHWLVPGQAE